MLGSSPRKEMSHLEATFRTSTIRSEILRCLSLSFAFSLLLARADSSPFPGRFTSTSTTSALHFIFSVSSSLTDRRVVSLRAASRAVTVCLRFSPIFVSVWLIDFVFGISSCLQPELRSNHGSSHELVEGIQVQGESRRISLSLSNSSSLVDADLISLVRLNRLHLLFGISHRPSSENSEARTPPRESSRISSNLSFPPFRSVELLSPLSGFYLQSAASASSRTPLPT